jgi:hypothetical protein
MRTCLPLIAASLLAGAVSAQATTTNIFDVYPGSTDAVTRSGLAGTSVGDVLVEIRGRSFHILAAGGNNTDCFASVGDINNFSTTHIPPGSGRGRADGFGATIQDQNGSTSETFDFCIVNENGALPRTPGVPPIGNPVGPEVLLRTTSLTVPTSGSQFPAGWIVNVTLATPADVIPIMNTWYLGCSLGVNALWTADGLAIQMASFNGLGAGFPNQGDNPKDPLGPSSLAWRRDVTAGTVTTSASPRTLNVRLRTQAPTLMWGANIVASGRLAGGAPNPCFGVAGLFPDACGVGNASRVAAYGGPPNNFIGRNGVGDGLALRMRAFQAIGFGGFHLLTGFLSIPGIPLYLNNPGFQGSISIDLTVVIPLPAGIIEPSGQLIQPLFPTGGALCSFAGTGSLAVQTLYTTPTKNIFSNSVRTHF